MELKITETDGPGGWRIITTEGEIDLATAPQLDGAFEGTITSGYDRIAIDLRTVSFMDSTGLRSLIAAHRRLEADARRLAIIADDGPARRLLEVAGVIDVLHVVASPDGLAT